MDWSIFGVARSWNRVKWMNCSFYKFFQRIDETCLKLKNHDGCDVETLASNDFRIDVSPFRSILQVWNQGVRLLVNISFATRGDLPGVSTKLLTTNFFAVTFWYGRSRLNERPGCDYCVATVTSNQAIRSHNDSPPFGTKFVKHSKLSHFKNR